MVRLRKLCFQNKRQLLIKAAQLMFVLFLSEKQLNNTALLVSGIVNYFKLGKPEVQRFNYS
jgi:hypothetical protein